MFYNFFIKYILFHGVVTACCGEQKKITEGTLGEKFSENITVREHDSQQ